MHKRLIRSNFFPVLYHSPIHMRAEGTSARRKAKKASVFAVLVAIAPYLSNIIFFVSENSVP